MYTRFFGLSKVPFALTSDPSCLFLTSQHREALAGLSYAVMARKGLVLLTGEAGTGKTTLLARIMGSLPDVTVQSSLIQNPTLTPNEFLEMALHDFGIKEIPPSKTQRILRLQQLLLEGQTKGKATVLIVDEAHKLSPDVLEEIRLLSNFEQSDQKLIQIVLAGQSELCDTLNRQDLRQLKQRIAVRLSIAPLTAADVELYMRHRWTQAGGSSALPFNPDALGSIVRWSHRIPRLINVICDNSLVLAFSEGSSRVTQAHVLEACRDLDLVDAGKAAMAAVASVASQPVAIAPPAPAPVVAAKPNTPPAAAKSPAVNRPAAAPAPAPSDKPMAGAALIRTLERYNGASSKRPLLSRWAWKLGLIHLVSEAHE
jgi:general secretion pathway protein A